MKTNNAITKDFIWNIIGTGLNSFNSLFFLVIITRINGLNDSGIFSFAFSMACIFYVIGIYYGRVYQVTDNKKISDNDFIVVKIIMCIIMLICIIMFIAINKYEGIKLLIILFLGIFKMLEAFSEVFYGIMQKANLLYKTGISLTIKSISSLLIFTICDYFTKDIVLSLSVIIVLNIIIMIFYDIKNCNLKYNTSISKENIKMILKDGMFPFFISFFALYVINSPRYAIDRLLSNELQAIFGIIVMPATIVSLIAQFIIYPFLNQIKGYVEKMDISKINKIIVYIIIAIILIGIIFMIMVYFIGIPILELIYNINIGEYLNGLLLIMLGAICNACVYVISNILISLRSLKSQTLVYFIMVIISTIIANKMVEFNGVLGACFTYMIIMVMLFILFLIIYSIKIYKYKNKGGI